MEGTTMKLVTAKQMQTLDSLAIKEYGIPGLTLMENAGRGAVDAMVKKFGAPAKKSITILVGPGNNGGDGLVIARLLHLLDALPEVYLLIPAEKLHGDAKTNYEKLRTYPVPIHSLLGPEDMAGLKTHIEKSRLVIDSLFGTGLTRNITGHFAEVIEYVNRSPCAVVAVDMPSGLDADTGRPLGVCIQADLTVTFGLMKQGQVCYPGKTFVGEISIVDIGLPESAVNQMNIATELLGKQVGSLLPRRSPTAHKGSFGHLLILAGSTGKTGAAVLCARGALRSGPGLVTLCAPHDLNPIFAISLCEAMTVPLPSSTGVLSIDDHALIQAAMAGKTALAVGPGFGIEKKSADLIKKIYREAALPMVVDADGLNILAQDSGLIKNPPAPRVLTPHPGEMARLVGCSTADIQNNRLEITREFAVHNKVCVVLKGAGTVIADPQGSAAINPTGNQGMAAGGMGDVLTGIIGGLLAQRLGAWQAACLGVFAHGLAGDCLAKKNGYAGGYLASELAAELPEAFRQLYQNE
jgi:NAD(P)H-hydrate epimerase